MSGLGFAFLVEISGHPSWAILLLIITAVAPSGILLFSGTRFVRLRRLTQQRRSPLMKAGVVLVMIGITVAACLAFDFNPRVAYYLPLLPSVLISAICFGFGTSLFTVIASIVAQRLPAVWRVGGPIASRVRLSNHREGAV